MGMAHDFNVAGLAARVSGAGRRVVLVHGVGSYKESWDGVIDSMGEGFEALRFDLRGHGASARTPGPYSLDMFCADLQALVRHLQWDRFDLVGFSLGGLIAQAYALTHPDQLRTLGIVSSVAGRTPDEQARALARSKSLAAVGPSTHLESSVERWFSDAFRVANPALVQERIERSRDMDPACFSASYEVLAHNDLVDRLHEIACPTIVMTGEDDVGSTARMATLMGRRMPQAEVHVLPKLRHSILIEAPALVGGLLTDFLRKNPA